MEVKLIKEDKKANKLTFMLSKSTVAFANALRRSALEDVPTLAIEDVEFRKNSSVLYDEMIGHRLGLMPIKTDLKSYNLPEECPCKGAGCAQCQLSLTLKSKGPALVVAEEIKPKDPKAKPVYPDTPVVKLLKGQTLEAEMTAILGRGKEHAKWTPGLVYYKYNPTITITKKGESCTACVEACPQHVFDKKGEKIVINDKNLVNCHLCGECDHVSNGEVKPDKNVDSFIFTVESWGQLDCDEIMLQAALCLDKKFDAFSDALTAATK